MSEERYRAAITIHWQADGEVVARRLAEVVEAHPPSTEPIVESLADGSVQLRLSRSRDIYTEFFGDLPDGAAPGSLSPLGGREAAALIDWTRVAVSVLIDAAESIAEPVFCPKLTIEVDCTRPPSLGERDRRDRRFSESRARLRRDPPA